MAEKPISIDAQMGEAIAAIGLLPPAVQGAMRVRFYDLLSHHQSSVLKRVNAEWPGKRRAQQMVASRSFRFTKLNDKGIAGIEGESFIGAVRGETFGGEAFEQWEEGASIHASGPMAIPGGEGLTKGGRATAEFRKRLAARSLNITTRGALIRQIGGKDPRPAIYGRLTQKRRQPPILRWHERWRDVASRDLPKIGQAIDAAMKASDKQSAELRARREVLAHIAKQRAYSQYLDANPRKFSKARVVARRAAIEAKKSNVVKGRR